MLEKNVVLIQKILAVILELQAMAKKLARTTSTTMLSLLNAMWGTILLVLAPEPVKQTTSGMAHNQRVKVSLAPVAL